MTETESIIVIKAEKARLKRERFIAWTKTPEGRARHRAAQKRWRDKPESKATTKRAHDKFFSDQQKAERWKHQQWVRRGCPARKKQLSKADLAANKKFQRKRWAKTENGKMCRRNIEHRRRAAKYNAPNPATPKQLRDLLAEAKCCYYCCDLFDEKNQAKTKTIEHVIPICRGGAHSLENIVVACNQCNGRKSGMEPGEWFAKIEVFKVDVVL